MMTKTTTRTQKDNKRKNGRAWEDAGKLPDGYQWGLWRVHVRARSQYVHQVIGYWPTNWLKLNTVSIFSLPGRLLTTSTHCKRSGWKTTRYVLTHSPGGSFEKENEHNKSHYNATIQSTVSRTQRPSSRWAHHGRSTLPMGEPLRLSPLLRATPSSRWFWRHHHHCHLQYCQRDHGQGANARRRHGLPHHQGGARVLWGRDHHDPQVPKHFQTDNKGCLTAMTRLLLKSFEKLPLQNQYDSNDVTTHYECIKYLSLSLPRLIIPAKPEIVCARVYK